jgi:hypothetical protein
VVAAATAAGLATLAACSNGSAEPSSSNTSSSPPSTSVRPSVHPKPAERATPGVPTPGSLEKPATSSGPLSKRSFPTPTQLGAGWRYFVDPGDAEEGYAGNGTPSLARSPAEVVQTAVPFGCPRGAAMPSPANALEVDYAFHGAKVIAVRGSFADPARSRAFFLGRAHNLTACAGRTSGPAIGTLVAHVTRQSHDALINDRTPQSDPWREVAVLDGTVVTLVAARGKDPLSTAETTRLVRLLRS